MALSGSSPGGVLSRSGRESVPIIDRDVTFQGASATRKPSRARPGPAASSGRKVSALIVALVMFGSFMVVLISYSGPTASWSNHTPIEITCDDDFVIGTNGVTNGSGTESDPWIISGYNINCTLDEGIYISGTTDYFVISNVRIFSTGFSFSAVELCDVINGVIEDSQFDDAPIGISANNLENVDLLSNSFDGCNYPISIGDAEECDITGNTMTDGETGIQFYNGALTCTVDRNAVSGFTTHGIYAYYSDDCVYSSNEISECGDHGIYLYDSTGCIVYNNTLTDNVATGYGGGGVCLVGCSDILVYHNSFYGNTPAQAYDDGTDNEWSEDYPTGGNYWDDYIGSDDKSGPGQDVEDSPDGIGDDPYPIDDGEEDAYPLMEPPVSTPIPEFTSIVVPVLVVMGLFLLIRRRQ